ncbi:hypothetical protein B0T25DRAFT_530940 [Lasiosphaeria hispida]|uniref:DUF7881 domain-containing protein n=1 Tax=Lasiosphaeria hispida TaxID=260671 RepID=A0AAJ0HNT3_9PEZI|nr:hypothetical protein B0T25DRAFT_530940 [Lasiosphaeria hispida]
MVNIIINVSPPGPFFLQDDNGATVAQDTQPLLPGRYLSWPMAPSRYIPFCFTGIIVRNLQRSSFSRGRKQIHSGIKYESETNVAS